MGKRLDIPLPQSELELIVILDKVSHPGNLGAVCRAMMNFGFTRLRLINPQCSPEDDEARNRAKHAGSILDDAEVFESMKTAAGDCQLIIGTSGKRETGSKVMFRHFFLPWELQNHLKEYSGKVALVFGEEGKGLSTSQLKSCDVLVTIPTWEGYPICNLSHSVAVLLYEWHRTRILNHELESRQMEYLPSQKMLDPDVRRIFRKSIEDFVNASQIDMQRKEQLVTTMTRLFFRGIPKNPESQQAISLLIEATTAMQKLSNDDNWKTERRRRINDVSK